MIYKYEEYTAAYPKKPMQALNKFKDINKNLHEMTIDEINQVVSSWDSLVPNSITNQKSSIRQYFLWLNSKGVAVDPSIVNKIEFPIKDEEYLIYSTDEIRYYWDKILENAKKKSYKDNEPFNYQIYWMCQAVSILSFYGLNSKQILDLTLSDIQSDGVIGYDLPLTQEDIDILIRYKHLTEYDNHMKLLGYKYIRSTKSDEISNKLYLNYGLVRIKCDDEYNYIKTLLTDSNLYKLGIYNRIFEYEKRNNVLLSSGRSRIPDWFLDIIGKCSEVTITKYKKEFLEYREERLKCKTNTIPKTIIKKEATNVPSKVEDDYSNFEKTIDEALEKALQTVEELKRIKEQFELLKSKSN